MKRTTIAWIILLAALAFFLFPGKKAAQSRSQPGNTKPDSAAGGTWILETAGQIGGVAESVVTQGNYAYVGIGSRLVIIDIMDPSNPSRIGQTDPLPGM